MPVLPSAWAEIIDGNLGILLPEDNFGMWYRRFKMLLLLVAALLVCWRGMVYNDPTGSGIIPVVMCELMGLALLMLSLGVATKTSDPLFI